MRALSRQTVSRVVSITAIVGIVLSVVATVIAFIFVGRLEGSVRDSLDVTTRAIDTVDSSINVTQQTVSTIASALESIAASTSTVQTSVMTSEGTLDTLHSLLEDSLPGSIEAIQQVLPTIEDGARAMDVALRQLSRVPFGPDYNPTVSFDQSIQDLSESMSSLPTDLRSLASDVETLQGTTGTLATTIEQFAGTVDKLRTNVDSAQRALSAYARTADEARQIAAQSKRDIDTDTTIARILAILLGLLFVILQALALWIVRELELVDFGRPANLDDEVEVT
jgi:septal ring factor EnvC (AmiA/AmiB activator)